MFPFLMHHGYASNLHALQLCICGHATLLTHAAVRARRIFMAGCAATPPCANAYGRLLRHSVGGPAMSKAYAWGMGVARWHLQPVCLLWHPREAALATSWPFTLDLLLAMRGESRAFVLRFEMALFPFVTLCFNGRVNSGFSSGCEFHYLLRL